MKSNFLFGVIVWGILISLCLLTVLWLNNDEIQKGELVEESNFMQSYTVEEKQIDMFKKWQERQPNKINQDKWDAYMGEDE